MIIRIVNGDTEAGATLNNIITGTFNVLKQSSMYTGIKPVVDGLNKFHLIYASDEQKLQWYGKFIAAVQAEAVKHNIKAIASIKDDAIEFSVTENNNARESTIPDGRKKRSKRGKSEI